MISKKLIERINFLYRKSNNEGLTEEEKEEQALLRRQYLDAIRARVKHSLDQMIFIDGDVPSKKN